MFWQLNRIQYPVYNLGKGKRISIWVQGCSLGCKDCISQTLHAKNGGQKVDIELLVKEIVKVQPYFDGITITGGEPFQQYQQLIAFCAFLKQQTNLEIYVFSGYYLKELYELYPDKLFLKYIDYLMDGRYVKEKHDNRNIKGSKNQTLYCLENEKVTKHSNNFNSDKFGLKVDDDMQVYMSGVPKNNEIKELTNFLDKAGINISFK